MRAPGQKRSGARFALGAWMKRGPRGPVNPSAHSVALQTEIAHCTTKDQQPP